MIAPRRFGALVALSILVTSEGASADEIDDKRACAAAHEGTQRGRIDGRLRDARAAAIACARVTCPAVLRVECTKWIAEIDAAMPAVVVDAQLPGGERLVDARIEIDGEPIDPARVGRAISVDPGAHVVRVSGPDGRSATADVVLAEREGPRRIVVRLPALEPAAASGGEGTRPQDPPGHDRLPTVAPPPERAPAWPVVALGSLGAAGLVTFGVFGLRGYREEVSLEATCAPGCRPGADDAMRRNYLVADVGLAIGVVALAGALWLQLRR